MRQTGKGLAGFYLITFTIVLLTWGIMAVFHLGGVALGANGEPPSAWVLLPFLLGGFSPSIAGLVMAWRLEGWAGVRDTLKRAGRFKLGWFWYLAIFSIPLFIVAVRAVVHLAGGGMWTDSPLVDGPLSVIGLTIQVLLLGPLSEEFGWRGFALDRMMSKFGVLKGSLLLGIVWAFWHFPLFFISGTSQAQYGRPLLEFAVYAPSVVALSVLFAWTYLGTYRSLWAPILFHATTNYSLSLLASSMDDGLGGRSITTVIMLLFAAIVATRTVHRTRITSRPATQPT